MVSVLRQQVKQCTKRISQLSKGFDTGKVAEIWQYMPADEQSGIVDLEKLSQCYVEISEMVDVGGNTLSEDEKLATKYRLMGELYILSADLIDAD